MYICILELRLIPAAHYRSIPTVLCMILYDVCILLLHIYEKNIIGTARLRHLHNPYYIRIDKLTRRHPSSRCRFSFELTKILRIM